jgi:DNA polymerase III delta prime subunit
MHHASIIRGARPEAESYLATQEAALVDTLWWEESTLTIAHVRAIIDAAHQRPVAGTHRTLVIVTQKITPEAQNALLKILEEPPASTRFIITVAPDTLLLPTVLSRVSVVTSTPATAWHPETVRFLAASYSERLDQIAKLNKAATPEKRDALLADLARLPRATVGPARTEQHLLSALRLHSGASPKLLLELFALALPEHLEVG